MATLPETAMDHQVPPAQVDQKSPYSHANARHRTLVSGEPVGEDRPRKTHKGHAVVDEKLCALYVEKARLPAHRSASETVSEGAASIAEGRTARIYNGSGATGG
jgi:hypothetical protein